jgi:HSP20 family protein
MAKAANEVTKRSARGNQKTSATKGTSEVEVKAGMPAEPPARVFPELERAFEDFLGRRWPRLSGMEWPRLGELSGLLDRQAPSLDIVDGEKEVVVRAEVPGVDKKDLDVSIVDRTLTIKGSTRKEQKEEKENYFRQEIRSGSFSRSVLLPTDVNASKAEASFKGGVLELHLPKTRTVKPQKVELK